MVNWLTSEPELTASDPLTLTLALHKGRAKDVLTQRGIPTDVNVKKLLETIGLDR